MTATAVTTPAAAETASEGRLLWRLRRIAVLYSAHRRLLVLAVLAGILNQVVNLGSAVLAALLVGWAITGATSQELAPWVVVLALLVLPRVILPALDSLLAHVMAFRTLVDIRRDVYLAFERLAPAYLLRRRSGDLGSTAISDIETIELLFAHTLSPLIVAVVVPVGAVIGLALFQPVLPLVLLPFLVAMASVPGWLHRRAEVQGRAYREQLGELNAEVTDAVQGLREVVAFGQSRQRLAMLGAHDRQLQGARMAHGRRSGLEKGAIDTITVLGTLAIVIAGGALVASGAMAAALFPACVVLAAFTFAPVSAVADVARDLHMAAAAGERILQLLDEPSPVADHVATAPPVPAVPAVEFRAVTFRYGPGLEPALDEVSFTVPPGGTVALVGHSGAGKSTCAHLLLRFWDVDAGAILVGGHDVREFPQRDLRSLMTFVSQDVHLFDASIAENIRLGRADASDADVRAAAVAATADAFISDELPDGYDTRTGERGTRLSGGQRQRVAIARAMLKDAPILVMDEAVSNLDTESERALRDAIGYARAGRTTLIIAHRLSTIRSADAIVVLERARVAEVGDHADLMARGGVYARLVSTQTDGTVAVDPAG